MLTDEEIAKAYWDGIMSCHSGVGREIEGRRAIASAACAERDARIAELERQLAESQKCGNGPACCFNLSKIEALESQLSDARTEATALRVNEQNLDRALEGMNTTIQRPVRRNDPMTLPWVVVGPRGVYYVGLHDEELGAWTVALGWPDAAEIAERKAEGWYAAQATMTWTQPNAPHEGRTAALSPGVPLDAVVGPREG